MDVRRINLENLPIHPGLQHQTWKLTRCEKTTFNLKSLRNEQLYDDGG